MEGRIESEFEKAMEFDPGKHGFAVMDKTGHMKIMWDPKDPTEVENARQTYNKMKAEGRIAWTVDKEGNRKEHLLEFDPKLEKMILSPPLAGG